MKKKNLILPIAMLFSFMGISAQTTIVKGVLADSLTHESEPYATIRVYKTGEMEKPVAMSVTDINGLFSQEVKGNGTYVISFASVGKMTVNRKLTIDGQTTINIDTVYTREDAKMLKGVEVVARKPLVKMEVDKMSYSVADDVDAKTNTVLDMLRKVPMVTVDGQDNITVNGSSSFKVYVDGKPNIMMSSNPSQIFKSMPASVVKNIEVVTNPGAKYDAEGVGGVLNLVMDKMNGASQSMDGINGTVRAMANTRGVGGSLFLSGQKKKLSYSANVMYNYSNLKGTEVSMERDQLSDAGTSAINYYQKGNTKNPFGMANLNLGYEIDTLSQMNLSVSMTMPNMENTGHPTTTMSGGIYGNGFSYSNMMKMKQNRLSFTTSLDYQRFFNAARDRSLTLTYMFSLNPSTNDNYTIFDKTAATSTLIDFTDRHSDGRENTKEHTLQADYTTPIGKGQTLNTGAKFVARDNTSDSKYYLSENGEFVYNEAGSLNYKYTNDILAGYAEYEAKLKAFGFKGGLRYEQTWQRVKYLLGNGDNFSKNYGNLVPTANVSYNLGPTQNMGLTYNMRISRPGISYLNPYIDRSSPTALSYGNTNLDVEKAHNISFVYNLFTSKWVLNVNMHQSFCNNAIEQYSFYKDNLLNTTYGNVVKNRQTGLNIYANWSATKTTRLMLNGGVTYTDLRSDVLDAKNNGWQGNMMLGIQQILPWDMHLSVFGVASTKSYTLQGWNSGFKILSSSLSKSFFNKKLDVSIAAVTGLDAGGRLKFENYSHGADFVNHQTIKVPISQLMLNVSFSFGNSKVQAKQHVSKVSNDYKEEKSQGEMLNNVSVGQ